MTHEQLAETGNGSGLKETGSKLTKHLQLISYEEMMTKPETAVDWLVEPLIGRGNRTLVFGDPGCMKSWLLLDLGIHLAAGRNWLGAFKIPCALSVLFIDEEMALPLLERRVRRLGQGAGIDATALPNFKALSHHGVRFTPEDMENLAGSLRKEGFNPDVVIAETLRQVLVGNEKEAQDIIKMWKSVEPLCQDRTTIVLTHHMKKPNANATLEAKYMLSGSGYILGGSDAALSIEKGAFGIVTVTPQRLRDAAEAPSFRIRLDANPNGTGPACLVYLGTDDKSEGSEEQRALGLLETYIREQGGVFHTGRAKEQLLANKVSKGTAERALTKARKSATPTATPEGEQGRRGWYRVELASNPTYISK